MIMRKWVLWTELLNAILVWTAVRSWKSQNRYSIPYHHNYCQFYDFEHYTESMNGQGIFAMLNGGNHVFKNWLNNSFHYREALVVACFIVFSKQWEFLLTYSIAISFLLLTVLLAKKKSRETTVEFHFSENFRLCRWRWLYHFHGNGLPNISIKDRILLSQIVFLD